MEALYIHKEQGKWHASALRATMDLLPAGQYEVTIKAMGRRSPKQNNLLHQLFTIIALALNQAGYGDGTTWTKDSVKDYCKDERLYPLVDMVLPGGLVKQMAKPTRKLTMAEASETIDRVIAHFAEEFGWRIPGPGEQIEMNIEA